MLTSRRNISPGIYVYTHQDLYKFSGLTLPRAVFSPVKNLGKIPSRVCIHGNIGSLYYIFVASWSTTSVDWP